MKSKRKISVIVLNYNGLQHLKEYFDSLYKQTLLPDEVVMMDNLSTDGSREFVTKHYPKVKIVTEDRYNTGTATASNIGFNATTGDYVIFQSNDLRLDKNCLKGMVEMLDTHKDIGICTSILIKYTKDEKTHKHHIDNAGGVIDKYGFGMQNYPTKTMEEIPEEGEVFFSYGGSFIIRREIFKKIGGFDDRFFTLNDDLDLSWRTRLLGYKIFYTKKSLVYHKVSATLKTRGRHLKRFWAEKNIIRSFIKNAELSDLLRVLPMYIALSIGEMGYFLYRGKFLLFLSDVKAILWNLWYLPDTLMLRHKIQSIKKKNNIKEMTVNTSFKLELFSSLKHSL